MTGTETSETATCCREPLLRGEVNLVEQDRGAPPQTYGHLINTGHRRDVVSYRPENDSDIVAPQTVMV